MRGAAHAAAWVGGAAGGGSPNGRAVSTPTQAPPLTSDADEPPPKGNMPVGGKPSRRGVPAPVPEAEEAVVEATDRAEGVVEASEAALAPPAPQPPAGHADLLVAMLTGALRAAAGGGHMHYHVRVLAGRPSCVDCGQRTDWECCCDGTPALCGPKYPCMATHQRAVPCPTTATVRAEFRHVRDAFHDATRAAVCEASEKARAAGRVRRVRRRTAQELKESETCRQ
eukprot:jgi/Tetstr1/459954/TSEL_000460.t1